MDIGKRLQAVRKRHGLSQRELASRAGLTNGTISLIEKNRTSPSIASLKSLLDVIPMSMSDFFATLEEESAQRYFFRAAEFIEIAPQDAGLSGAGSAAVSLRQIGPSTGHSLQVLYETYAPGSDTGAELLSHDGEEAGVVVSGKIEITVSDQIDVLGSGDGYIFDSALPHRFRNISDAPCVVISACTPPTF